MGQSHGTRSLRPNVKTDPLGRSGSRHCRAAGSHGCSGPICSGPICSGPICCRAAPPWPPPLGAQGSLLASELNSCQILPWAHAPTSPLMVTLTIFSVILQHRIGTPAERSLFAWPALVSRVLGLFPRCCRSTEGIVILRYIARIVLGVGVADESQFRARHTDLYEKRHGCWVVVWSQATTIAF